MISRSQESRSRFIYSSLVFLLIIILSGCNENGDTSSASGPDPQTQDGTDNQQSNADNDTTSTPGQDGPQTLENHQPKAKITPPQPSISGQTVTLNGSGSSDPDGDTLSYQWTQTRGAAITLSGSTSPSLIFIAPSVAQPTQFSFQLTVNDGELSNSATVSVLISPAADKTSPSILSRSPLPDQSGVSTSAEISVGFDEALLESSVDGQSLLLSQSGSQVPGDVSYDSANKTINNKPASALSPDTTYTVTLANTLVDLSGNAFAGESWSFSTSDTDTESDTAVSEHYKPRVIATTDGELDDRSSMVRFLMYASDFDIEGIVQVNGVQKSGHSKDKWIEALIDKYDEVLPNLRTHNPNYPSKDYLLSVLKVGNENSGDLKKAPDKLSDSEGAQLIMKALMDDDPRPVHILAWGGANTQANALWQIKEKYPDKWPAAAAKARLYCIWYQDGGGSWIEDNLPEIKIFEAGAPERDGSWRYVWDYMSVDGKFKGRDSQNPPELQKIMDTPWLTEHIRSDHGPLAAAYSQDYTSEGDSPSFMPLVDNGLEHHTDYTLGGWGGRSIYEKEGKNHLIDGADENNGKADLHYTFQRWLPAAQNDWASRADWCVATTYADANHQPVARVKDGAVRDVMPGQTVTLDASGSTDPDGNTLSFKWWQYHEADNADTKLTINDSTSENASFVVPDEPNKQLHVILEVTDDGEPVLTRYQRVIFNIIE